MTSKVWTTGLNRSNVFGTKISLSNATVHFHRTNGCNTNNNRWGQARFAAFDIHELLSTQVSTKARFGHNVVSQFQSCSGCDDRVAAVGDVREWTAVYECWVILERLHYIWLHCVFQQNSHRTISLDVTRKYWCAVTAICHDHVTQAFLQILQVFGQAKNGHNLRGNRDIEPSFTWETVGHATQRSRDLTQRTIVHVNNAAPYNAARIDL